MTMQGGYPAVSDILAYLSGRGIEELTEYNNNFLTEFRQLLWALLNAADWTAALGVYCPSATTFNVRGGSYLFKSEVKTYTPSSAVDPTDNDTTYIWMKPDNTIGSGIDGSGWPTTEHIKLAEIDVNSSGNITAVRDMRGKYFLNYIASYLTAAGTSVEALAVHWDSPSPADDDEIRIPLYAENDNDEKIEYARLVTKLTDVSDGDEDAEVSLMAMIAGTLTSLGNIVGATATQTLTNKTLTSPTINAPSVKPTIEAHTANDTLTTAETGSVHSNLAAGGAVTLTLPASAPAGTVFSFAVQAAQELRVDPGTATIRDDSGQTPDKYKVADAIGECITLIADANGDWATIAKNGTWTEEA